MRPLKALGVGSLAVVLFAAGFGGRQLISASAQTSDSASAIAASVAPESLFSEAGYRAYAAIVIKPEVFVLAAPNVSANAVGTFKMKNPEGAPTTFLVKGEQREFDRPSWYQVLLPVRPNGTRGWVRAEDVSIVGMRYRVDVHLGSFKLELYDNGRLQTTYRIGTGTPVTPTPEGEYSIIELLRPTEPRSVYGKFVLGLSGYSDVLVDWPGGGHLAIHGTNDPARTLGHRVSHGCIRLQNEDIESLARILPLGTPVRVIND